MGDGRPMRIAQEMPESNPDRKHRVGDMAEEFRHRSHVRRRAERVQVFRNFLRRLQHESAQRAELNLGIRRHWIRIRGLRE